MGPLLYDICAGVVRPLSYNIPAGVLWSLPYDIPAWWCAPFLLHSKNAKLTLNTVAIFIFRIQFRPIWWPIHILRNTLFNFPCALSVFLLQDWLVCFLRRVSLPRVNHLVSSLIKPNELGNAPSSLLCLATFPSEDKGFYFTEQEKGIERTEGESFASTHIIQSEAISKPCVKIQ